MTIGRGMAEAVEAADRLMKVWDRVHDELEDGKHWNEIDNGWREPNNRNQPYGPWKAYMQTRMINNLRGIILCYRHIPKQPGS